MTARWQQIVMLGTVMISPLALACPACDDSKKAAATAATEIRTLTPAQLHAMRATRRVYVFDANPRDIFDKHHVPGAVHVEYDQVTASQLPTDQSEPVVFYCMNERCGASPVAARRATELGWRNAYLMPAGIQGWLASGLQVEGTQRAKL